MSDEAEKVSLEVAEADVRRVLDALDLELDSKDVEDIAVLRFLTRAIQRGNLSVDDEARFVLLLDPPVVFNHPKGADLMQLDKKSGAIERQIAIMASVTKKEPKFFAGLKTPQFKLCQAIVGLFLS